MNTLKSIKAELLHVEQTVKQLEHQVANEAHALGEVTIDAIKAAIRKLKNYAVHLEQRIVGMRDDGPEAQQDDRSQPTGASALGPGEEGHNPEVQS